ncbi:MAG: hypothetical protein M3297_01970 [Thermoproteota archaeon]|nr:hypothetical protein [Thermoproteota archaeon]
MIRHINTLFIKAVDNIILDSKNDKKLAQSIRWIDMQSRENGVSFYEMAYIIASREINKKRAKEWLKNKRPM